MTRSRPRRSKDLSSWGFSSRTRSWMDDARKASIKHALQTYRDAVLAQNVVVLELLVQHAEDGPQDADGRTEEEIQELRLSLLREQYGLIGPDTDIATPRDVLRHDILKHTIYQCSLDGIDHGDVDLATRSEWVHAVHGLIDELNVPHIQNCTLRLPDELQYLATEVKGICGPGLPYYREYNQWSFLIGPEEALQQLKLHGLQQRVVVPIRQRPSDVQGCPALDHSWQDWEIALGVRAGDGPHAWSGPWIVFCRRPGDDQWKWRYGVRAYIDYESELFDRLEEFLAWYAHFNEQTEETFEPIDVEQVM